MCEHKNKLVVAAAGSGKTTFLVKEALKRQTGNVLVTTFTQANEAEIRHKIIEINGCIPKHITVQTWFSFLLQHGVKPYQGGLTDKNIRGIILAEGQSGIKFRKNGIPVYYSETKEFEKHYFSQDSKVYSDKLSKLAFRCNQCSDGAVIRRIAKIYTHIMIDEVQDLAGYDLNLLELLFKSSSNIVLVGDPRQGTYSTNNSSKNKQYQKAGIVAFFENHSSILDIDTDSFSISYRCNQKICDFSNKLFLSLNAATSGNDLTTEHDGVFLVRKKDIGKYLEKYKAVQLRDSSKTTTHTKYTAMNFGESKGLSFERTLIYSTKPFIDWLHNKQSPLAETSRSKLYVALTRARQSVGIVFDYDDATNIDGAEIFT